MTRVFSTAAVAALVLLGCSLPQSPPDAPRFVWSPAAIHAQSKTPTPVVDGPTILIPETIQLETDNLGSLVIEWGGDSFDYAVRPSTLGVFREYDPDPLKVRLRILCRAEGVYYIHAVACKAGKMTGIRTCKVVVGKPGPVPPGPDPVPPGPVPPGPLPPAPIPVDGFRVLMVYETGDVQKLPSAQAAVLFSKSIRDYLDGKCVLGPDGKTREWRIWDQNIDPTLESSLWQTAMKRPRASIPWIVISTGKTGYEGPLPKDVEATLDLLKKFGG